MDIDAVRALIGPPGRRALAVLADEAASLGDPVRDPLGVATRLRRSHPEISPSLAAAALTQVRLRARAVDKFGDDARRMYFTPDGLEQATRGTVAAYRARAFAGRGVPPPARIADLCCGMGADLLALAREGHAVRAVDRDPVAVEVARANARALGVADRVTVTVGEAGERHVAGCAAAFCDPSRRTPRTRDARRVFNPAAYSPPLPVALALAARPGGGCVKAAPGIPHEFLWDEAGRTAVPGLEARPPVEGEWISHHGEVKEAALWVGGAATAVRRRATLLPDGACLTADPAVGRPAVAQPGRFLYEPDGAVIRAHLIPEIAALLGASQLDPSIAYLTSDSLVRTPFAAGYEVTDVLPFSMKRLRTLLRERGVGIVTVKKRGLGVDVERFRAALRLRGEASVTVVLTRTRNGPIAVICRATDPAAHVAPGGNRTE